jgi:two-component system KDP operon response regulator KdpE
VKKVDLILIVEDDKSIQNLLSLSFKKDEFKMLFFETKKLALQQVLTQNPDIILIDIGLPDGDGKELIVAIRKFSNVPIIVISARSSESEIVNSLNFGADDYLIKPFSIVELIARVKSIMRRNLLYKAKEELLICRELKLNLIDKIVIFKDEPLKLTPTEFNLLRYLMLNSNKTLTHHQILKEVWGIGYQNEMQYLRTYINMLRKKIEENPTRPIYIRTESGIGYRFYCSINI